MLYTLGRTRGGGGGGMPPPSEVFLVFFLEEDQTPAPVFFRSRSLVRRVHFETRFGNDQFLWLRDMS